MMNLDTLDAFMQSAFSKWPTVYLFRIGSSLNPEWFTEQSDIDYLVVVEHVTPELIASFPRRVSPMLPEKFGAGERIFGFFWRLNVKPVDGHAVTVCIYTADKFYKYVEMRSPPKCYVLNEHKLLLGSADDLAALKRENPPDRRTAEADFLALSNPKYRHAFLWEWRATCLLREGRWLRNKREIAAYVEECYPGRLGDVAFLKEELSRLLSL